MSEFIQIHLLVSYPPSNLNRDDLGRPKTAMMGGTQRLRISSQSLKRAWRKSDLFEEALSGHIGIRTKSMGVEIYKALINGYRLKDVLDTSAIPKKVFEPVSESKAKKWAQQMAGVFGKIKTSKEKSDENTLSDLEIEQLAHFSPEEIEAIDSLIEKISKDEVNPNDNEDLKLLREKHKTVDIAMFGRMLASAPKYNVEAAVQVSHAITVHKVAVEDDYFTAVDDLNRGEEDQGAGHLGETEFSSGLFYNYLCINHSLLEKNLGGDKELTKKSLSALIESVAKVAPTGKQNSFASRAYASYILVEKGKQQPRSLSVAFLKALDEKDLLAGAITVLESTQSNMDKVYGKCSESHKIMNAHKVEGSLSDIVHFVAD